MIVTVRQITPCYTTAVRKFAAITNSNLIHQALLYSVHTVGDFVVYEAV